jgi:hypothetical protein
MSVIQFVTDVLGLFSGTLSAVMSVPIFSFFLSFLLFGVGYAFFRYLYYVAGAWSK